jgi:hypothetical protein
MPVRLLRRCARTGVLALGAAVLATMVLAAPASAAPEAAEVPTVDPDGSRVRDAVREWARATREGASDAARLIPRPEVDTPCAEITGDDIPKLVTDIFQCRFLEAGYEPGWATYHAAEAVVVARCESLFDADAIVFNGAFLHQRHPYTGMYYSAAGVFQFIRKTADDWIVGGYDNVVDPSANIDAAARLVIRNKALGLAGWDDWACAMVNDGFKQGGSELPGYPGGPAELPAWAFVS